MRKWASERFPLPFPVRCYIRPRSVMEGMDGYFEFSDCCSRGTICICEDLTHSEAVATFVEEWAHARTAYLEDMDGDDDDPHHHAAFWSEFGRVTNAARRELW